MAALGGPDTRAVQQDDQLSYVRVDRRRFGPGPQREYPAGSLNRAEPAADDLAPDRLAAPRANMDEPFWQGPTQRSRRASFGAY